MTERPRVENAPGLKWKPLKVGWQARWRCRNDLVARGYETKMKVLWTGTEMTDLDRQFISDECQHLQSAMLLWGAGSIPGIGQSDGTVGGLIACYQTDQDSTYRKLRYRSRQHTDTLCSVIAHTEWEPSEGVTMTVADTPIADIKARVALRLHEKWSADGKVSMGHAVIGQLRTLCSFGATILEDEECVRLSMVLSKMRFAAPKPRNERLTADQVVAIRNAARPVRPSLALGQAFQFECMFRQKDVIGEWVPLNEPGPSMVILAAIGGNSLTIEDGNNKWMRGIRWEEIGFDRSDDKRTGSDLVITHVTSKRQKEIKVDLRLAPMVMEELAFQYGPNFTRADLPASGPIIINERDGIPWTSQEYRRYWRMAADACGVPKEVRNMDSRAGAISEATDAGAELEHVRQAATHSDIAMTQKYSRGATEKIAGVQTKRNEHRANKAGT